MCVYLYDKGEFWWFDILSKNSGNWWNVMTFAPYLSIHMSFFANFGIFSWSMSSNPMKMYLMCVSQYLSEKWLLPQQKNLPNDIYTKNISQMKITLLYQCIAPVLYFLFSWLICFFLHMSDKGCFTFIIHHFVRFMGLIIWIFNERIWKSMSKSMGTSEYKNCNL